MSVDGSLFEKMTDLEVATMLAIATHLELSGTATQRSNAARLLPLINSELAGRRAQRLRAFEKDSSLDAR